MLKLALYYEQTDVAQPICSRISSLTFFEAASMPKTDAVRVELERDPSQVNAFAPDGLPVLGSQFSSGSPPSRAI